jgi:hypothetical protein
MNEMNFGKPFRAPTGEVNYCLLGLGYLNAYPERSRIRKKYTVHYFPRYERSEGRNFEFTTSLEAFKWVERIGEYAYCTGDRNKTQNL